MMEIFVQFIFWMSVLGVVLRAILIAVSTYPRRQEFSSGSDVFVLLTSVAMCAWAAYVIWGAK